jgi:ketosteroid isomerase-like protein
MRYLLTFSLLVFFAGCGQQEPNLKDEEQKIIKCWQDWPMKAKTGKPELEAYYFADSAIFMGQEVPLIKGKPELIKFFSVSPKFPALKVNWGEKPNIIGFSRDGDMAYSLDRQELSITDSAGTVQTKVNQAIHVWKKDRKGNWKVDFLMTYPVK